MKTLSTTLTRTAATDRDIEKQGDAMNPSQGARQRGAILPLVAISMVVLLGFMALALDIGLMMWRKSQFQSAVDAAALSAAQCRFLNDNSEADANACGRETLDFNLATNGVSRDVLKSQFTWSNEQDYVDVVVRSEEMDSLFAGIFGEENAVFRINAVARAGMIGEPHEVETIPLIVPESRLCPSSEQCDEGDYHQFPVRAEAIFPDDMNTIGYPGKDDYVPGSYGGKLAAALAGTGHPMTLNKEYRYCQGDDCRYSGYGEMEEFIEEGLNSRFECDDQETHNGALWCNRDDDDDEFSYRKELFPPDKSNATKLDKYVEKTSNYRRIVNVGIGARTSFNKIKATKTGCFLLLWEVDDPGEWWDDDDFLRQATPRDDDVEGIWLRYISSDDINTHDELKAYCGMGSGGRTLVLLDQPDSVDS